MLPTSCGPGCRSASACGSRAISIRRSIRSRCSDLQGSFVWRVVEQKSSKVRVSIVQRNLTTFRKGKSRRWRPDRHPGLQRVREGVGQCSEGGELAAKEPVS